MRVQAAAAAILAGLVAPGTGARAAPDAPALVQGGRFDMGTPSSSIDDLKRRFELRFPGVFEEETPEHEVTVSDFRMDRREVTNAQFAAFVASRPEWSRASLPRELHNGHYLEHWKDGTYPAPKADHPVVFVTWHAAQAYCRWAGGRLPSEAEWEYAARAGDQREFPWGADMPTPARANYSASGRGDTAPVGSYEPNALGLHDMAGNVWELLLDAWQVSYGSQARTDPVAGGPVPDTAIRSVGGRRGLRGGSYAGAPANLRTRWRDSHVVTNAAAFVGFRCAYPDRPPIPLSP